MTAQSQTSSGAPDLARLRDMAGRFAPTPLDVDTSQLSAGDKAALPKLIEAARILDDVFMKQLWSEDVSLFQQLQKDNTSLGRARLRYFWINKGPWSDIDEFRAFLPDVPERKPLGANFYPIDLRKDQFEQWLAKLPQSEQEKAKGFFTVIRWKDGQAGKQLVAVPYSEEYRDDLARASSLLHGAAKLTDNASLRKFLDLRADALLSNDYYQSDVAWMDLDAPLDITYGPYETYNDELFGYKAAFEAYINLRDDQESAKLSKFTAHLQEIEDHLPIDPQYRNPKLGASASIRVVDQIMSAGDGAHGVQTAAYNLPNDERVVQQKGSKRVMLKNVQEAKFRSVLIPISKRTLSVSAQKDLNFDSFFTHILAHELMHGLGPHQITVQGRPTNPREQLKDLYSAIEEAKADVTGLFAMQYMMDHAQQMGLTGTLPTGEAAERQLYTTYLASTFRSLRFGLNDAHGKGTAVQFNFFVEHGGFLKQPDGTFGLNLPKMKAAVADLDRILLTLEAQGDYAGAKRLLDEKGVIGPELQGALDRLQGIPTDIEPIFVTADRVAPGGFRVPDVQ